MKENAVFFKECHLAGREYHEADEVWDQLKVGTELRLERDTDNRYDPEAVAVMFDEKDSLMPMSYLLGYIPRGENKDIAHFLDMGWDECFQCRISKINPEEHYEEQIRLIIKIVQKQK